MSSFEDLGDSAKTIFNYSKSANKDFTRCYNCLQGYSPDLNRCPVCSCVYTLTATRKRIL